MNLFRGEKQEEDERSCSSSDCSSSLSSSSSFDSSWSNASSASSDESNRSFLSLSSNRRGRNDRLRTESQHAEDSFFRLSSLIRHRNTKTGRIHHDFEEGRQPRSSGDKQNKSKYNDESAFGFRADARHSKTRKRGGLHWSTSLLAISLLIWCGVQIVTTGYVQTETTNSFYSQMDHSGGRPHRFPHRPPRQGKNKEMLQPGCELDRTWQVPETNSKLLSCQFLHELDLSEALSTVSSAQESNRRQRSLSSSAYLASGLWRDVWKIRDTNLQTNNRTNDGSNFVVLKTMKPEHELDLRNFERHRREAATMSRLTKSPHVADLFAYCGNSILTEFASQDLSHALKTKPRRDTNDSHNERRRKIKDASSARRAKELKESDRQLSFQNTTGSAIGHDTTSVDTASTLLSSSLSKTLSLATRIDLALQASKAIADVHRSDVIHADITTKQFLVISPKGDTQRIGNDVLDGKVLVKINDFNRCRFVPRRQKHQANTTSKELGDTADVKSDWSDKTGRCTIRIPSAPGSYRSPEEYSDQPLTPQMDVYSLGHVLYEIWTGGQHPWQDVGGKRIKNMVMAGGLPTELQKLKELDIKIEGAMATNNTDARNEDIERAFGRIISKCYLVDPARRITADDLVREFTKLLDSVANQSTI